MEAKREPRVCKQPPPEKLGDEGLDRDYIACIIERDAMYEARDCYEATFKEPGYTPEPVRITTKFTIGPDGNVTTSTAESDKASEPFKACVAKTMKALVFTKPYGGKDVKISYPFLFKRTTNGKPDSIFDN
jgi:hypothetical protein